MKKFSILIAFLLWLPLAIGGAPSQNEYDQFQKALMLERADGKLQEAITLYRQVVSESQDESLAAKAQLQIGICYEKLGQNEARAAYQTVIDKYPRQLETVKTAKERIARLVSEMAETADKPRFRKIDIPFKLSWWAPTPNGPVVDFGARLSPDGRTLAFGSEGSIWTISVPGKVSPDIAGEPQRLTEAMYALGEGISWSADGRLIAFRTARMDNTKDIYVVPSNGGKPTKYASIQASSVEKLSLSPDGGVLAYQDDEGRIKTIARGSASPKILIDTKSSDPAFSPDGRLIAYVSDNPIELRVIPASGGESIRVVDASNRSLGNPVWSPDGRMLALLVGMQEIWIVQVSENGFATTTPTIVKLPGRVGMPLAGWTPDNKIGGIYGGQQVDTAIYSVPASGGGATQISPSGLFHHPRWSPDGERILFLTGMSRTLGSVPSGGGTISKLSTDFVQEIPNGGGNFISPDGKKVVFFGGDMRNIVNNSITATGIWIMPLEGGQPTPLTVSSVSPESPQDRYPCWSHDGKSVLFVRTQYPQGSSDIYMISAEGGEARPITSASDEVASSSVASSPDGKWVAYFSHDSALSEGKAPPEGSSASANCIKIKPIDGGPPRIVTPVHHLSGHEELSWSPDGKMIAYNADMGIGVVPANGGEPKQVETGLDKSFIQNHVSWSPDGRTFAFSSYRISDPMLWMMEDFLPLVKQ
jgi:Tol biopolymer transport system component